MHWNVGYGDVIDYILSDSQVNPQYCLCKRYFPVRQDEKRWFGESVKEVISVDGALFPEEEQIPLTEEQAEDIPIEEGDQVLRVFCMLDGNGDLDIPYIAEQKVKGYVFCGFDLSDFLVSAILNCGSFTAGDYFSKAFDHRELNGFGLIPDYRSAVKIRQKLKDEYPDGDHAYCAVFAIWRRV